MKTMFTEAAAAIMQWAEATTGAPVAVVPSRVAMLASPSFVRTGAKAAEAALSLRLADCRLYGVPLLDAVRERDGWLLLTLAKDAFDAYACTLPTIKPGEALERENADFVDSRMDRLLRYGDRPLPACETMLRAILVASIASTRGRWTRDDERAVLTMTHGLSGRERIETEHRAARAAKIILTERIQSESRGVTPPTLFHTERRNQL